LSSVGLYTLRHTCATLLLLADQPAKVVSERLGHSSITLTAEVSGGRDGADPGGSVEAEDAQGAVVEIGYS
jgi:integrase